MNPIEHADAKEWLKGKEGVDANVVVYDPPYAVGSPVRGREDGAAGSVFAPFGFLHQTLALSRNVLAPGGVCLVFCDWRRMADLAYIASTVGLRASTCVSWVRTRPGTGGFMRSAWDPILVVSRGTPSIVDKKAVPNVIMADYPTKKRHPYQKPRKVFEVLFSRVCIIGDLIVDPFAGSGVTYDVAEQMGLKWFGCDIDSQYVGSPANKGLQTTPKDAEQKLLF